MTTGELLSLLENSMLRLAYFSWRAKATKASKSDPLYHGSLGIVAAAVQTGLLAVLGMHWPVSDTRGHQQAAPSIQHCSPEESRARLS